MRGQVLHYDDAQGQGLISGDDGARYAFTRADMQRLNPVRPGDKVEVEIVGIGTLANPVVEAIP